CLEIAFYFPTSDENKKKELAKKALASLWLAVNLGGFGARSRRLYGSLQFHSAPDEKPEKLFENKLPFVPLSKLNLKEDIPKALDEIASIMAKNQKPLPLLVYLYEAKAEDLEKKYEDYRKHKLIDLEKRAVFGLPLQSFSNKRFASQIIFKALNEQKCLITIIKSFEISEKTQEKLQRDKDEIIEKLKEFCNWLKAELIYPQKEGGENV
ncbi:MAG: hypothetical protein ACPLPS_10135, partial [bacterium]